MTGTLAAPALPETTQRMVPHADLKNSDLIWATVSATHNHRYMVWATLSAFNEQLEPRPQVMDVWKVGPDGLTYTLTLRDGLRWSNGRAVAVVDCAASVQR
jgi:peptide/nickel transport system substrate-binding protein